MANKKQSITLGIAVASAFIAMFVPVLIALPLFVLAALLIAWALQPKGTEAFSGRVPYGNYVLKALAKLDSALSGLGFNVCLVRDGFWRPEGRLQVEGGHSL